MSEPAVVTRPVPLRIRDALYRVGPVTAALAAGLAVALLWGREVFPTNFVGEVQSPSSLVSAPEDGRLVEVNVRLFDVVTNGQVLGRLRVMADESIQISLAALRADLEIMRVRLLQDQQRNNLSHLQAWQDLMTVKIELTEARIRLRQAESEYERVRVLFEEHLAPAGAGDNQTGYEVALRDRELLRAEVADKERLVAELEQWLGRIGDPEGTNFLSSIQATVERAIRAQEEQLLTLEAPAVLRASTGGMVMRSYRHAGEQIVQGETLFEIQGPSPEWILGYVRQPITYQPRPGDVVRVISRSRPRREARASVQRVGAHLQAFAQPLRARGFDASQERGLPVLLDYPPGLELHPGELVDLVPIQGQ